MDEPLAVVLISGGLDSCVRAAGRIETVSSITHLHSWDVLGE